MTNTFLVLKNHFGDDVRVSAQNISTYKSSGAYTEVVLANNEIVNVFNTVAQLDQALSEIYFMVKPVQLGDDNVTG